MNPSNSPAANTRPRPTADHPRWLDRLPAARRIKLPMRLADWTAPERDRFLAAVDVEALAQAAVMQPAAVPADQLITEAASAVSE